MEKFSVVFIATTLCLISIPSLARNGHSQNRTSSAQTPATRFFKSPNAVPKQYVIRLNENVPRSEVPSTAARLIKRYGGIIEYTYQDVFKGFSVKRMSESSARALSLEPQVLRVEETASSQLTGHQAWPAANTQTRGLDRIDQRSGFDGFYNYSRAGSGVHVYVVDTGVWSRHAEFEGRAKGLWDFEPSTSEGGYASGLSANHHGTLDASYIGSKTYGVAKNCQLYSVRVAKGFGTNTVGTSSAFINGLQQVISDVNNNNHRPAVVNISLGFNVQSLSSNELNNIETAVTSVIGQGITVVAGAGNTGVDASTFTPARMTNVITVGATVGAPGSEDQRALYPFFCSGCGSNFGSRVDIYAPSGGVVNSVSWYLAGAASGTDTGGEGIYGTSAAAPLVTGAVALYLEKYSLDPATSHPQPAQVEAQIKQNASTGAVSSLPILYVGPEFITPPDSEPSNNSRFFVRQQYYDFLSRQPDQEGWDYWTDNIDKCNDPARRPANQTLEQCISRQRETTSAAFFVSPEFQYTGYYVYRLYQGSLGRKPTFSEFFADKQIVADGIVVGGELSATVIEQNKAAFANQFTQRPEFGAIYDSLSDPEYVDKLFETTTINASATDRADLVSQLNTSQLTRAQVLQKVVDGILVTAEGQQEFQTTYGHAFYDQQYNPAFVQMEYFGYLRRDPDTAGYNHWLDKLNFYGDFVDAEMVLAFIISPEYLYRFGFSNQ